MRSIWGWVFVAAVVLTGCARTYPPFNCGREGATCGATPGATCVDNRCAVPSSACASGLVFADNAGELAGDCVFVGGDGGTMCGNGSVDPGEDCEGSDVGDTTCASL